ncbi:unnamed protein product [Bursaphelenchus xylophilus]|uniref:(pine wood nematode) hypothetical protein n=1 Tax=Bursaphelenchus xylophilus TaxID=6326 RepID=A0A1I7RHN3_BURXY|nr:unnamed protein product [Bursaphelenchus xylophilus]CAG9115562.1 unnamed protein product [Bursaphelenchus xylophilus]
MSASSPQASTEFVCLLRNHYSRAPEPLWKLLDIVVHMLKRGDENATTLLHAITEHCLCVDQILSWWYQTRLLETGHWYLGNGGHRVTSQGQQNVPRHNASSLCEEIVRLWGLCSLNPKLTRHEKEQLYALLTLYHERAVRKIWEMLETSVLDCNLQDAKGNRLSTQSAPFSVDFFPGFFPALQLCFLDWKSVSIKGLQHSVDISEFMNVIKESTGKNELRCFNIPILKHSPDALFLEFIDTEQQITSTLNHHELNNGKTRSKRYSRRKRRRRQAARNAQMALQDIGRALQNQMRRFPKAESDESATEDVDQPSTSQSKAKQEPYQEQVNHLFALAHEEMDKTLQRFCCCEALYCYGYVDEAQEVAEVLANDYYQLTPFVLPLEYVEPSFSNLRQDHSQKLCKHMRKRMSCKHCKHIPPAQFYQLSRSAKRSLHPPQPPPSLKKLEVARAAVESLNSVLFVLKCLLQDHPISPLGSMIISEGESREFSFEPESVAMKLALKVLLEPRGPAPTRQLEVNVAFLELQLFKMLMSTRLTVPHLELIREAADSFLKSDMRTSYISQNAVPPILFAHYVLNALSYDYHNSLETRNVKASPPCDNLTNQMRKPSDENLAMAVALAVLQIRPRFHEKNHPMLMEYIRKQKGEMTLELLRRNCDSKERLNLILDKFLDAEVHCIYPNCQTNAILVRNCGINHNSPFCLCWKREETSLPLFSGDSSTSSSENNSRRDSTMSIQEILEQSTSKLNKLTTDDVMTRSGSGDGTSETSKESKKVDSPDGSTPSLNQFSDSSSSGISNNSVVDVEPIPLLQTLRLQENAQQLRACNARPNAMGMISEDHAHFLMEFAKRLFGDAGGNHGPSFFHPAPNTPPNRNLHMCAFIIGLYSLGVNNHVSDMWRSRTYSTMVSWIQAQALELGSDAIQILNDVWETHMTPSEVAELADKVKQNELLQNAAIQLYLNVLKRAWSLTFAECQRALDQCAEFGMDKLERACLAVEESAKHESLNPQVLFKVSECWYKMYNPANKSSETSCGTSAFSYNSSNQQHLEWQPPVNPPPQPQLNSMLWPGYNNSPLVPSYPPPNIHPQCVQASQNFQGKLHVSHSAPNLQPMIGPMRGPGCSGMQNNSHRSQLTRPNAIPLRNVHISAVPANRGQYGKMSMTNATPYIYPYQDHAKWKLLKAYEIGMWAFELVGPPNFEDNHYGKFSKHPEFEQEIKSLLSISKDLGALYLHQFCEKAAGRVASPSLLMEIIEDADSAFREGNGYSQMPPITDPMAGPIVCRPSYGSRGVKGDCVRQLLHQLRYPTCLQDLAATCTELLYTSTSLKLSHPRLMDADKEDITELLNVAMRLSGMMRHHGHTFVNEFFNYIRKQKSGKQAMDHIKHTANIPRMS